MINTLLHSFSSDVICSSSLLFRCSRRPEPFNLLAAFTVWQALRGRKLLRRRSEPHILSKQPLMGVGGYSHARVWLQYVWTCLSICKPLNSHTGTSTILLNCTLTCWDGIKHVMNTSLHNTFPSPVLNFIMIFIPYRCSSLWQYTIATMIMLRLKLESVLLSTLLASVFSEYWEMCLWSFMILFLFKQSSYQIGIYCSVQSQCRSRIH